MFGGAAVGIGVLCNVGVGFPAPEEHAVIKKINHKEANVYFIQCPYYTARKVFSSFHTAIAGDHV